VPVSMDLQYRRHFRSSSLSLSLSRTQESMHKVTKLKALGALADGVGAFQGSEGRLVVVRFLVYVTSLRKHQLYSMEYQDDCE